MTSKHICPKCGGKKFFTPAHVMEEWVVDEHGNFLESAGVIQVDAFPDDDDVWICCGCGEEAVICQTGKENEHAN